MASTKTAPAPPADQATPLAVRIDQIAAEIGLRPVRTIRDDLDRAKGQYMALRNLVDLDAEALREAQTDWHQAMKLVKMMDPSGGKPNPLFTRNLGPLPVLEGEPLKRCNALHALAYVVADLEHELSQHSIEAQRRAYRDETLSEAGINLKVVAEATNAADAKTAEEHAAYRRELCRKAGLADPSA